MARVLQSNAGLARDIFAAHPVLLISQFIRCSPRNCRDSLQASGISWTSVASRSVSPSCSRAASAISSSMSSSCSISAGVNYNDFGAENSRLLDINFGQCISPKNKTSNKNTTSNTMSAFSGIRGGPSPSRLSGPRKKVAPPIMFHHGCSDCSNF